MREGDDVAEEELRAILRGNEARLGRVRAQDVARLITGLESAMAAAAYAAVGKSRRARTGWHRASIESSARLTLRDVQPGSVVAILGLPTLADSAEAALDIGVDDLAGAAFHRLIATFGLPDDEVDQGIARALAELCDNLGIGERHEELLIESSRRTRPARLDRSARARMRRLADAMPPQQPDVLAGYCGRPTSIAAPPGCVPRLARALAWRSHLSWPTTSSKRCAARLSSRGS